MTLGPLLTGAGYLTGALVLLLAARQRRLATEGIAWLALAGFCGGVFFARLTEWGLAHFGSMLAHPAAFLDPRMGGKAIIGGVLGGWVCVELAKRYLGIRRSTGDLFALSLPAGEAVGRLGCFFNGCCYGTVSNVPWAVYQHGAWRHPAQFYACAIAAAIFCIVWTYRDKMPREGDLFKLYLLLYGIGRFTLEFVRERDLSWGGLSMVQWVCLELVVTGGIALWISRRRAITVVTGALPARV